MRAVLLTLFEGFTLRRVADPFDRDVFSPVLMGLGDGYELQPDVREDAIAGFEPSGVTAIPQQIGLSGLVENSTGGLQM